MQNTVFIAGVGKDAFQSRHLLDVKLRPHLVADEEQLGIGVVDDVMDLFGMELMKDGDGNSTIGDGGKECNTPACRVAAADGNLVALSNA